MSPESTVGGVGAITDAADTALPEIYGPPAFEPGCKVRALKAIRNDGTYPGSSMGTIILEPGAVGYVTGVGEFLQRFYIYRVDFVEAGRIIGMRRDEIEAVDGNAVVTDHGRVR